MTKARETADLVHQRDRRLAAIKAENDKKAIPPAEVDECQRLFRSVRPQQKSDNAAYRAIALIMYGDDGERNVGRVRYCIQGPRRKK